MQVQNCGVVTGSPVLGAPITVATAVRTRTNRLARRMTRLQSAALATVLCGTVALVGSAFPGLTSFDSLRIEKPNLAPIEDQLAASLSAKTETVSANTESADAREPTAINNADTSNVGIVTTAAGTTGSDRSESTETAVAQSSQQLPAETPPVQMATRSEPDAVHTDTGDAVSPSEIVDECLVPEICIDQYLWSLYQRTPKRDTIKVEEQRKVTVKKKGKTRTVIEKFTKLVDEDFTWKDPKAAEKASMSLKDYVIGGMDRSFKLKLYRALRALDDAGLSPGITSAFRDDYRQSLVSGLKKAASDRSYHGGSLRGGYGHGLAVDLVSVKGETRAERSVSSASLWRWIDEHGKEFGIGRPYLDKDPPHVAPIDGKEYVDRREALGQHAGSEKKKRTLVARDSGKSVKPRSAYVAPIDGKEYVDHREAHEKHAGSEKKKRTLVARDSGKAFKPRYP